MDLKKLLSKGHLIPVYEALGGDLCLVGYRRKATSRKAHQRPFMLQQPIVLGPMTSNPASSEVTGENPERSQKNINEE